MNEIMLASAIAHLLEYSDTSQSEDYAAAMSNLRGSGIVEWAEQNDVLLPVRRDGVPQFERMAQQ